MQRALTYLTGLLRSCNPKLGTRAMERHGPWFTLVLTVLSVVVDQTSLVVGEADLRLLSAALVLATMGLMHAYRQEP